MAKGVRPLLVLRIGQISQMKIVHNGKASLTQYKGGGGAGRGWALELRGEPPRETMYIRYNRFYAGTPQQSDVSNSNSIMVGSSKKSVVQV